MRARTSPGRRERATSWRAMTPGKRLVMPRMASSGGAAGLVDGSGMGGRCVKHEDMKHEEGRGAGFFMFHVSRVTYSLLLHFGELGLEVGDVRLGDDLDAGVDDLVGGEGGLGLILVP